MTKVAALQEASAANLVDALEECHYNPARFIESILLAPPLRGWQAELCGRIQRDLEGGNRRVRVLVRSCHGAGKSWLAGAILIWFLATRRGSRGLTLAPTWSQVENALWPNIGKLFNGSLFPRILFGRVLSTRIEFGRDWFAMGSSSDNPQNLEGLHAGGQRGTLTAAIRICDEAKAIDIDSFDSTEGLLDADESIDFWISTPSLPTGPFFDLDVKVDESTASVLRAVVDVDRLIADDVEGKAEWKADRLARWGEADPRYRSRVMAEYIDDVEGSLFPVSWIERAFANDFGDPRAGVAWRGEVIVGDDVAGSADGDLNAAVAVQHLPSDRLQFIAAKAWAERDTMVSKGKAQSFARELTAPLRVDGIGIGKGVLDASRQDGYPTQEYRASDKARADDRYINRKAEDAFAFRKALEEGRVDLSRVSAEMRPLLKSQMVSMRYEELASGKAKVIDPTPSPDLFDALLIASARVLPSIVGLPRLEVRRGR